MLTASEPYQATLTQLSELEAYDEVLDRRLWTHFSEGLSWQQTLSSRRRTEPINAQLLVEDLIMRERELDSEDCPPMLDVNVEPGQRGRCEFCRAPHTIHFSSPLVASGPKNEKLEEIAEVHSETTKMIDDWRAVRVLPHLGPPDLTSFVSTRLLPHCWIKLKDSKLWHPSTLDFPSNLPLPYSLLLILHFAVAWASRVSVRSSRH